MKILAEKLYICVIIYFDDIFVYIKSKEKKYMEIIW